MPGEQRRVHRIRSGAPHPERQYDYQLQDRCIEHHKMTRHRKGAIVETLKLERSRRQEQRHTIFQGGGDQSEMIGGENLWAVADERQGLRDQRRAEIASAMGI